MLSKFVGTKNGVRSGGRLSNYLLSYVKKVRSSVSLCLYSKKRTT